MKFHKPYIKAVKWLTGCAILGSLAVYSCKDANESVSDSEQQAVAKEVHAMTIPDQYIISAVRGDVNLEMINGQLKKHMQPSIPATHSMHTEGAIHAEILQMTRAQYLALKDDRNLRVEEDRIVTLAIATQSGSFNLPFQYVPWGIKRVKGPVSAVGKRAWIIDSGVEMDHPDLTVDKRLSKSFLTSSAGGNWRSPTDEYGHGTTVAGVIAAKDNAFGVVGVAAGASVVAVKVFDSYGRGSLSELIQAVNYVAKRGKAGEACNISIAAAASETLDQAVQALGAKGIFVAIGSGNSNEDCSAYSPQRVNALNVYTVSGMDSLDAWMSSSNFGSNVKFSAPAKNITTTALGGSYQNSGGTSMAAPHMAGVLLVTGGRPQFSTYVLYDPDNNPDPIVQTVQ